MPPIYDYHQMIRAEDIESAQDLLDKSGSIATPGHIDCAICMNPVEVVTTDSHASYASSLLARRAYMVSVCCLSILTRSDHAVSARFPYAMS